MLHLDHTHLVNKTLPIFNSCVSSKEAHTELPCVFFVKHDIWHTVYPRRFLNLFSAQYSLTASLTECSSLWLAPVSYTHLDVYKRQAPFHAQWARKTAPHYRSSGLTSCRKLRAWCSAYRSSGPSTLHNDNRKDKSFPRLKTRKRK